MGLEGFGGESRLRVCPDVLRCIIPSQRGCVGCRQDLEDFLLRQGCPNREFGVVGEDRMPCSLDLHGLVPFGRGREQVGDRLAVETLHQKGEKGRHIRQL